MYHINIENERRPNFIVRGLYHVFAFLSDFGPMFGALFGFLGRFSLVVVNLVILCATIIVSAAHSLELLRYAGATGGLEWVFMCAWELVFIFSSIILANDFRRGNPRSGWAPWVGFLIGFSFVEISNIMGMADNWIGIAIGFFTPILLLVSKGLLAHQFKTRKQREIPQEMSHENEHNRLVQYHTYSHSKPQNLEPVVEEPQMESTQETQEDQRPVVSTSPQENEIDLVPQNEDTADSQDNEAHTISQDKSDNVESQNLSQTTEQSHTEIHDDSLTNSQDESHETDSQNIEETSQEKPQADPPKNTRKKSQKKPPEVTKGMRVARRLIKKGEKVTINMLAEKADITPWYARVALKNLETEEQKKAEKARQNDRPLNSSNQV